MIWMRVRTRDTTAAVKRKVDESNYKSLQHAAASIRQIARRSIRRRKATSAPGEPPSTQTGTLKHAIRYEVDRDDVVVGPVNEIGGRLWDRLEFGGNYRLSRLKLKTRPLQIGDFGPIRKGRMEHRTTKSGKRRSTRYANQYQRVRLRTADQVRRANRLIAIENQRREAESQQTVHYRARPFMGPALAIAAPRIPAAWRNSVR